MYTRQAQNTEAERQACEIRLRAERRCGELLVEMVKAKGGGHVHASRPDQSDDLSPKRQANSRISRRILLISDVIFRRCSIVSTDRKPCRHVPEVAR